MVALQVATLWLAMIAPAMMADARTDGSCAYQVVVDDLEVMTEPSDSSYLTGVLHRGDQVVVLSISQGWARIKPPLDTFEWINAADLRDNSDGTGLVASKPTTVRYAIASARLPGPPCRPVARGIPIRLLDRPDLKVGDGDQSQTWRAIEPGDDEVRFLRSSGIALQKPSPAPAAQPNDRPEQRVSFRPEESDPDLPVEVNQELTSLGATTRSIKAGAVEGWDLSPVRSGYESLLRQYDNNPRVKAAVQSRLDQINRDQNLTTKAREFARILRESDSRDAGVARIQRSVDQARTRTDRKFDAQGLLQASSRQYRGQKVLALIGPEGRPISYLTIPPGMPINRFLARKVGVRGVVHFDEGLGARLISVRDLEVIEKIR